MKRVFPLFFVLLVFCLQLTSSAFAAPKTVGVIVTADIPFYRHVHDAFIGKLSKAGHGGAEILKQTPAADAIAWANAARKLVAAGVDVIVAYGTPATLAILNETSTIPIVSVGADHQAAGIKGKNVTGVNVKMPVAGVVKNLKAIKDFKTLGVICNTSEKESMAQADEVAGLGGQWGFASVKLNFRGRGDTEKIKGVDALFITTSCMACQFIPAIASAAKAQGLPSASLMGGGEQSGVILTVSPDGEELGGRAAEMVSRILKGEQPSGIPVEAPRKMDMIINLKEAGELGLKVPLDVLSSATKIIK